MSRPLPRKWIDRALAKSGVLPKHHNTEEVSGTMRQALARCEAHKARAMIRAKAITTMRKDNR